MISQRIGRGHSSFINIMKNYPTKRVNTNIEIREFVIEEDMDEDQATPLNHRSAKGNINGFSKLNGNAESKSSGTSSS